MCVCVFRQQNGGILDAGDLRDLGITQPGQQQMVLDSVSRLPITRLPQDLPDTVEAWLESIRLPQYTQNFHKNGFGEMERVRKVWEIELTTVLEITRPGHRKRILASLGDRPLEPQLPPALNPHDLSLELSKLVSEDYRDLCIGGVYISVHSVSMSVCVCLHALSLPITNQTLFLSSPHTQTHQTELGHLPVEGAAVQRPAVLHQQGATSP